MCNDHYSDCSGMCYDCNEMTYCLLSPLMKEETAGRPVRKIYLASSLSPERRPAMHLAVKMLRKSGHEVYAPVEHKIENAWDYPNKVWGRLVFEEDIKAIDNADCIVAISYGRENTTAGSSWEIGYAYGKGKKVVVVEMDNGPQSLMVSNGCHATVTGLKGLAEYDFGNMPRTSTESEQK